MKLLLPLLIIPSVSLADTDTLIDTHILPGYATFAAETQTLADVSGDCDPAKLEPTYHAAFDAWMGVSHIQFGPIEMQGLSLAIAFWPDPKNQTAKTLGRLILDQDDAVADAEAFSEVSVAAQGLFALEYMLYEAPPQGTYGCALIDAIATQLARHAATLNDAWIDGHAETLRGAGSDGSAYQSEAEVRRVIYTSLSTGLEFLHDQRLGRPLGSFDRPRPKRAEAWRSARSQRNIELSLAVLADLASILATGETPRTDAAFLEASQRARGLDDPALQGVADPSTRFKVEVLQQKVADLQAVVTEEIGAALGVRAGFNALDGD
ncbi:imelysin family protein [Litoreibacter roseus]|uniref:Signal peptidase n=1 Tax=Litoreibacter roseus TaxID=2601869 RepID=A0A6N6JIZ1_9RHOB|nr:imelysin family protein [Litoreibacter roseus]GFE66236.1 signal peptidase [Litoreibacter roseus]